MHKAAYLDAEIDITLAAYAFSAVRAQFADHGNVGFDVRSDITKSRICFVYTAQIIEPWSYIVHVTRAGFSLAALAERVASIAQRVS